MKDGRIKRVLVSMTVVPAVLFVRRQLSDNTLGYDSFTLRLLSSVRLTDRSLYGDRFYELRAFWRLGWHRWVVLFVKYGWPSSTRFKANLMKQFDKRGTDVELYKAYERTALLYTVRLVLGMHRGEWLVPFLGDIEREVGPVSQLRALDYGCGVGDIGVLLASLGAVVSVSDLENRKMDFVRWRFESRGLTCAVIPVCDTERIPDLGDGSFDLVVATEILEHVRDPLALLKALTRSLRVGGMLFCSMGNTFDREVGGDHLAEAVAIGNSAAYRDYFQQHYQLCATRDGHSWLFRKTLVGENRNDL